MSNHLCESCKKSVRKGSPVCKCDNIEWNDEPMEKEGQKWYNAGIIQCTDYTPVRNN
jgi:hypothetical protein